MIFYKEILRAGLLNENAALKKTEGSRKDEKGS
jgi:hypothetical protein